MVAGALVTMVGALCYVRNGGRLSRSGGEYSFLRRAWGGRLAALYAWSRFAIMHTGWIALMAHLLADYASALWPLGHAGRTGLALAIVAALTGLNLVHVRLGFLTQALLVALVAAGFACVTAGLLVPLPTAAAPCPPGQRGRGADLCLPGLWRWSDMATLSGEVRGGRRAMLAVVIGAGAADDDLLPDELGARCGLAGLAASTAPGPIWRAARSARWVLG
jgi:hypothetical protein